MTNLKDMLEHKKIAIIGCGNLGTAIVNGLISSGLKGRDIIATRTNKHLLTELQKEEVILSSDNCFAVRNSEIVIIAVKPHNVASVLNEVSAELNDKHLLISLASAVSVAQIKSFIPLSIAVVRAMPNTAADVAESITCLYTGNCDESQKEMAKALFDCIGETVFINEELMNAATILGACGIAYALRFMRAMIQGGIQVGFDAKTATAIATQTVKGAAELLIQRNEHPEKEIDKVTTPKGCTIVGLNEMEHSGFSSSLIKGIVASYKAIESN
jgi:pyrroline-5-carboxylate reductase